jgi:Actin-like ATPase involved in cell morphogenesis
MSLLKSIKNSISNNLNWVSGDIAIDLGTANTLIWLSGKGIIINEPSIIARNSKTQALLAVGDDAKLMQGKTHEGIEIIRPLRDGVISDFTAVDEMLQGFIRKVNLNRITRPRMVICVPSGCTEVERRAVRDSGEKQAAREVFLVDEPVAAAIGIELDISKPIGNVIVDIGGGTTEVAVISLNGVVTKKAIKVAGDVMDHDIQNWFRNNHRLEIGDRTAEQIKISVGSAMRSRSKKNE